MRTVEEIEEWIGANAVEALDILSGWWVSRSELERFINSKPPCLHLNAVKFSGNAQLLKQDLHPFCPDCGQKMN